MSDHLRDRLVKKTSWSSSSSSSSSSLVRIPFRLFAVLTVSLPLCAFLFCVVYSLVYMFKTSTHTHCGVFNFLPSISAAISIGGPQSAIWKLAIALHTLPRLLLAAMYGRLHFSTVKRLRGFNRDSSWLPLLLVSLNVLEVLSLVVLSFCSSKDNFSLHKMSFVLFVVSASLYFLLSLLVFTTLPYAIEGWSIRLKKVIVAFHMGALTLAAYFYRRHNLMCEPGVYSLFALSEYVVVLSNMAFHLTAAIDFKNSFITV